MELCGLVAALEIAASYRDADRRPWAEQGGALSSATLAVSLSPFVWLSRL